MAPSHLHPRSRMTSSLFATTVLASFFVVALPHVLPCPAPPRVAYADSSSHSHSSDTEEQIITITNPDGTITTTTKRRRRGTRKAAEVRDGIAAFEARDEDFPDLDVVKKGGESTSPTGRQRRRGGRGGPGERECPVPKPGGVIGELMGFSRDNNNNDNNNNSDTKSASSNSSRTGGGSGGDKT
ncbi:hypothetical protein MGN70_009927 [Eutypa lata]|nr:hypothetical protein MGN70_009927 [Eutypa lata]